MDDKEKLLDDIEIIEDIEDEEVLFLEDEVKYNTTYAEDTSLKDNDDISLGETEEVGHSVNDALTKFATEENTLSFEMPKEVKEEVKVELPKEEMSFDLEGPSLSDELDNTLILAERAINPRPVVEEDLKDESKSNKRAIIFIVVLFILLAAAIFAFPFIKELF
jgi:hypothetical protein